MQKFKSNTGKPVRISQISGHITTVGVEFAPLHERFHKEAYANGCISNDMVKSAAVDSIPTHVAEKIIKTATKQQRIMDIIREWVADNRLGNFSDATGKPDARILTETLGEAVSSYERDEAWYKHQEADDKVVNEGDKVVNEGDETEEDKEVA